MSFLSNEMRAIAKKEKLGKEKSYQPMYPTGIDILDYAIGRRNNDNTIDLGVNGGKLTTFIGASGSGKTTFAIQAASHIIKNFDDGIIAHWDFEHATDRSRVQNITGMSDEEFNDKYLLYDGNISADTLFVYINKLHDAKMDNFDKLAITLSKTDDKGDPITILPPSIIILDSVPTMYKADVFDKDEMKGQMDASAQAKYNNQFIKRLVGSSKLQEANIMIFAINHVTTKIDINPMQKSPKELNYLKQGEALVGGTSFTYLADTLIRLTPGAKLEEDKDYHIKGFYVKASVLKSRANESGREYSLIYDQTNGFSNPLSNLDLLYRNKLVTGGGASYHIDDPALENVKFSRKTFMSKYTADPEFHQLFDEYMDKVLVQLIPTPNSVSSQLQTQDEEETEG